MIFTHMNLNQAVPPNLWLHPPPRERRITLEPLELLLHAHHVLSRTHYLKIKGKRTNLVYPNPCFVQVPGVICCKLMKNHTLRGRVALWVVSAGCSAPADMALPGHTSVYFASEAFRWWPTPPGLRDGSGSTAAPARRNSGQCARRSRFPPGTHWASSTPAASDHPLWH